MYYYNQFGILVPDNDGKVAALSASASYNLRKQREAKKQDSLNEIRQEGERQMRVEEQRRLQEIENKKNDFGSRENALLFIKKMAHNYSRFNMNEDFTLEGSY